MSNPFPSISAILCTCGREVFLKQALRSLIEQSLPAEQYEVIVVENGLCGKAKKITQELQNQFANILYLHEPLGGLSRARNAGLKTATGPYLAFLDDDAVADKFWLGNILKTFAAYPGAGAVGGKILPLWEQDRPPWVAGDMLKYLSILDYGDQTVLLGREKLFGTNIAFNKDLLEQIGGFSLDLGRKASNLLSGEEALAQEMLLRQGYGIVYNPDIRVEHQIPAERLSKEWFEKRAVWEGVSNAIMNSDKKRSEKVWTALCQAASFIRKPRQLLSLVFNLRNDAIFSERVEAKIKINHIKNILKKR